MAEENDFVTLSGQEIEDQHESKREEIESAFGVPIATPMDKVEYHERAANEAMQEHIKTITDDGKKYVDEFIKEKYGLSPAWSKGRDYKKPFDYVIESSGQEVKIRRLDMGDLLKLGIGEEMDFMTKALMSSEKKETGTDAVASAVMGAGNFENMEGMINKVVLAGLITPRVHTPPMKEFVGPKGLTLVVDEEAKKENVLYVDDVPFTDRMELFSVIFDSDGLATFRGEQADGVGDVETVPSVSLPAD